MTQIIDFEALVNAAGDAIVVADIGGKIVLWNPAAERIFGFKAAEAIGRTLDLIIPERYRDRHWSGFRTVMQSGETRYGSDVLRVPALHQNGAALSIAFTVALLRSADGRVQAIAAIVRDETARWKEERDLQRRIKELEQQTKKSDNAG
ncbi:MAG TPA: PAS domain S-box protein [Candidatus Binatia bacterium]|jgi:PAS domain S-box-containing protein